jgi:glycosyltransferase involved in cell wall biosynthesis
MTRKPDGRHILFVSWTPHSRPRDLARRLEGEYFVPASFATSWWWPARYGVQAIATLSGILRRRPSVVLFTNPPFLAGLVCLLAARLTRAQCWADCHSGAYNDPRWTRFARANAAVVRGCDGTVFHNALLAAEQREACRRSLVLSTYAMNDRVGADGRSDPRERPRPLVVAVCNGGFDKPLDVILAAAELTPQLDVAITGRLPARLAGHTPANVRLTGWLSEDAYHDMIAGAAAVLCLTTREATMQNGIIEALEHRRPVVTSDTRALTEWAREVPGIVTVGHEPEELAAAIRSVVEERDVWLRRAEHGQQAALRRARAELSELQAAIGVGNGG